MTELKEQTEELLASLLHLGRRARQAKKKAELGFILVNETLALSSYRQAALWTHDNGIEALSGVAAIESQAPYVQWLNGWCESAAVKNNTASAYSVDLKALPETGKSKDWASWLPPHIATIELPSTGSFKGGCLILANEQGFGSSELTLLQEWGEIWSSSYAVLQSHNWGERFSIKTCKLPRQRQIRTLGLISFLLIFLCLPVRLTVLAPAELIPLKPDIIRAPLDGIVDKILVTPNQRVKQDQTLFEFDRISLASRLEVAKRSLETTQTEYRQRAQQALFDLESKSQLVVLQSLIKERRVEVDYLNQLNERSQVHSPREGVVLFDDANSWVGRPVVTGERVMVVADENQTQLEAWVSPSDMVSFPEQALIKLYLDADPLHPLTAKIETISYQAEQRPEGHYSYRVRALLARSQKENGPRIGLKGTAKLYGERAPLIYWILRRPWASFRAWIGL